MSDEDVRRKLQALIEEESDPKERARLLVMLQISSVLVDNVRSVRGLADELHNHRTEFSAHMKRELALLNQGRGGWRVLAVSIAVVQVLLSYIYFQHMDDFRSVKQAVVMHERQIYTLDAKMENALRDLGTVPRESSR